MSADKLKEEEKVVFREAFKKFDPEGSDLVPTDEIGSVLRAAGQAPTEAELEDYKKELDPKETGDVEYKNLIELYARIMKSSLEMDDELTDAFKVFDKNMNGYITASDLRKYMTTLGEKLSDDEVDEMIKDADINGDGKINYAEFTFTMLNDHL